MSPVDPADAFDELVDLFNDLSQAIDEFRLSDQVQEEASPEELARLKDEAQGLEDRAHHFVAQSMAATLSKIQPDLKKIKSATAEAKQQLDHLNDVSKAISIATAGLAVGAAIATGNVASIAATTQAFVQAVT